MVRIPFAMGESRDILAMRDWMVMGAQLKAADPDRFAQIVEMIGRINAANEAIAETGEQISALVQRIRERDRLLGG